MTKPKVKLTPPDPKRCQAEIVSYHPFVMGGSTHQRERCKNNPVFIVTETKPGKDGMKGSMSLCPACFVKFSKQMGAQLGSFDVKEAA